MDVPQGTQMGKDYSLTLEMEKSALFQSQIYSGQKVSSIHTCKWGLQQNSKNLSKDQSNLFKQIKFKNNLFFFYHSVK